jgi:hypothetical protein
MFWLVWLEDEELSCFHVLNIVFLALNMTPPLYSSFSPAQGGHQVYIDFPQISRGTYLHRGETI